MKGKNIKNPQLNVFRVPLVSTINMEHELVLLAGRIDWELVDSCIKKKAPRADFRGHNCFSINKSSINHKSIKEHMNIRFY